MGLTRDNDSLLLVIRLDGLCDGSDAERGRQSDGRRGTNVLALVGSSNFSLDQLATFTGIERVTLGNAIGSFAQLSLGSQPIEVDPTGNLSISINSPIELERQRSIDGDAPIPMHDDLSFNNDQVAYPPLPVTVTCDQTSNAFGTSAIYGDGDNVACDQQRRLNGRKVL